jgi:sortase A
VLNRDALQRSPTVLWRRRAERTAWVLAVVLAVLWARARGLAHLSAERTHGAVEVARPPERDAPAPPLVSAAMALSPRAVDQKLWDRRRIRAYALALARPGPPPIAVLRIPRLRLEAPVLEGTDDWTLDRGVGHIAGTPLPGEAGNVGIAGHRDGFFRVLKDIVPGDLMELALPGETRRYRVQKISLVRPDDVSVIDPDSRSLLTLVTCYPFYIVGSAPKRFIVRSQLVR